MRWLDLFSGIGGIALGLGRAGFPTPVGFCECDHYCQRVLKKHWPIVPIHSDIRELTADAVGSVELVAGGFPCQDISGAGRKLGINGSRSGLWTEQFRLVRALRPRWVLVENVTAILVRGIDRVLGDLATIGYDAEWDCIPATFVGAPHERDRLFLVAYPSSESLGCRRIFHGRYDFSRNIQWSATQNIRTGRRWKRWLIETCEAMDRQGCNPWFRRVDDGVPGELDALRALGNAVVPQVAELIGRSILDAERGF